MPAGDLYLLLKQITGDVDHLHAVKQRPGDGRQCIGCGNEQNPRQVEVHIHIIIMEMTVLLRIKHLEQSRRRIALIVTACFVYFIEQQHRIDRSGTFYGIYDPAGHRADVCAAVAADLGLVMQSTERDPLVTPAESTSYRLAERSLSNTGSTDEADYRRTPLRGVHHHGKLFEYALLHLLESVMVSIQYLLSVLEFPVCLGHLPPRQISEKCQICIFHRIVRTLRVQPPEFLKRFIEGLSHSLGHIDTLGLLLQRPAIIIIAIKLLAQSVELLLQEMGALLAVDIVACLPLYLSLQLRNLLAVCEKGQKHRGAVLQTTLGKHPDLISYIEGRMSSHQIDKHFGRGDILHIEGQIAGSAPLPVLAEYLKRGAAYVGADHGKFLIRDTGTLLLDRSDAQRQSTLYGLAGPRAGLLHLAAGRYDGRMRPVGKIKNLQDICKHTIVMHIIIAGIVHRRILLAEHSDHHRPVRRLLDKETCRLAAQRDRECHPGKHDEVAHRDDGEIREHRFVLLSSSGELYLSYRHYLRFFHFHIFAQKATPKLAIFHEFTKTKSTHDKFSSFYQVN